MIPMKGRQRQISARIEQRREKEAGGLERFEYIRKCSAENRKWDRQM